MAADTPPPTQAPPQVFNNIRNASSNLAAAISNQITAGVNRTTNLMHQMTDALALALNTTKRFSLIDQTQVLGGKLSNASAQFLNATSHTVAAILNVKLNAINAMVTAKSNIANTIVQISQRFVSSTGKLLSRLVHAASLPPIIPRSVSAVTDRLLKSSINLVNATDVELANLINATSAILSHTVDEHNNFATQLLNSTARLINSTTESLENLLNTTNNLIDGVIQSRVNASNGILNETSNLLNASSHAISSFLNATTLIINNAPNDLLTRDGSGASLSALDTAQNALSTVFNRTSDLIQGVLAAEKNIESRLVNATDALFKASFQLKATLVNATRDLTNSAANSIVHFVETQLTPRPNAEQPPSPNPIPSPASSPSPSPSPASSVPLNEIPIIDTPQPAVNDNVAENPSNNAENAIAGENLVGKRPFLPIT